VFTPMCASRYDIPYPFFGNFEKSSGSKHNYVIEVEVVLILKKSSVFPNFKDCNNNLTYEEKKKVWV
jgi:hypothetical protein